MRLLSALCGNKLENAGVAGTDAVKDCGTAVLGGLCADVEGYLQLMCPKGLVVGVAVAHDQIEQAEALLHNEQAFTCLCTAAP